MTDKKSLPFLMRFQHVEGIFIASSIFYLGYYYLPPLVPLPDVQSFSGKLQHVIYCSILPGLTFLVAIGGVLRKRVHQRIVNPLAGRDHLLKLEHNFVHNTFEQLIVYLVSTAVLSTYLAEEQLKLVALNALVFTLGRLLFRVGYGIHPKYRGVGVWCFMTSQALVIGLCIYFLYTKGLMYGLELDSSQGTTKPPTSSPKHEL